MLSQKNKYIVYLVLLNGTITVSMILFWNNIFEDVRSLLGMITAAAFFFFYETFIILWTDKKRETLTPRQSINLFLALKVGKIMLSLLFIAVYVFLVKTELKRFVLIFVVLYFIYLLFDTIYLADKEKK